MTPIHSLITKLPEEIDLISSENLSHRIHIDEDDSNLTPLVHAVNRLADRYEELTADVQQRIQLASAETEEEKNILAAFISELPEGVLICNADGQILLYNRRVSQFLDSGLGIRDSGLEQDAESEIRLGSSVFTVMDRSLITDALDDINERLKRDAVSAVSHFVAKGRENRILQAQIIPILNNMGQFTGFIILLNDITRQREADTRVDALLQSLTKSARSPLASVRSAIEAIIEYPDMDTSHLQRFREIIHKESITLSEFLNKVASEYSSLVKTRGSLVPMSGADLTETLARRAKDRMGILLHIEAPGEKTWVKIESHSMLTAILFVLNQLKNETGSWEFACKLGGDEKFVTLDLLWQGDPVGTETLRKWEDQFLMIEGEKSPLTLKEVLRHHEAEIWSSAGRKPEDTPYIRFLLPADETSGQERMKPIIVVPESHTERYNLDLFHSPGQNPELDNRLLTELTYTVLLREISETASLEEIMGKHSQLPGLIHRMISGGARMQNVSWLITAFSDAILKKLLDFAIGELGPPPVRFAFIVLGSEGRKEQTLKTDQDNAIIFEDIHEGSEISEEEVTAYFLSLGEKVCTWLDQAGYDFCKGEIMAKTPKWCQPLATWKKYFYGWIHAAEPDDLLHSSIFFDFRFAYGDDAVADSLSKYLFTSLVGWTGFFRHFAENAVYFKPPLGLFGNFVVESKGEHRNCLNIKKAMTMMTDFTRLYALKNMIRETNTQERLYQLYRKKVLSREEYNEIEQAYSFMMQLRFVRQITAMIEEGAEPDNHINPKKLSRIEQKMLKEVLKKLGGLQAKLRFEFIGVSDSS